MATVTALTGILVSAVVAAVLALYLDVWSSSGAAPGTPGVSAQAEMWWDLSRDHRTVRADASEGKRTNLGFNAPGGSSSMDSMIARGGVHAGYLRVRLILVNFSKAPAVVTSVRARVVRERPIPAGPTFRCGPQGSGEPSRVKLSLAQPRTPASEVDENGDVLGRYPVQRYQLAKQDDPGLFDIEVTAGAKAYDFVFEIEYQQGGRKKTVVADDAGRSFTLAPIPPETSRDYVCNPQLNAWTPT
ncbi:hypothetical protein ACFVIM_08445 [Streptomyces sp. NPDC057638]|uniref:hypothetical protein n=1 Tax=Streptomyces sp. NPDC057638 TaxID=3346190 RepID=UPI00369EC1CB